MGFKRPLVQIQSLGPNKQGYLLVPLFVCFGYLFRTPAASCFSIIGRYAAVAASIAAAAAGSNPVTRTKKRGYRKIPSCFSIIGRYAAVAASIAAAAAGSNPVTRTRKKRHARACLFFLVFVQRRYAARRSASLKSLGGDTRSPSQTRPMRDEAKQTPQRSLAFQSTAAGDGTERPGLCWHPIRPLETERADGLLYGSAVCYSAISDTGVKAYAGRLT